MKTIIEEILEAASETDLVLFVSDPWDGDRFEFGNRDKLQENLAIVKGQGFEAEIRLASEFLDGSFDFEVYESNEPWIVRHKNEG